MNPFNLLINYVIANSRATFYNVPGNQEITNTALLTGMVSENPLMSYLIIDNKAKIEGEKFMSTAGTVHETLVVHESFNLPSVSGTAETKGNETPTQDNAMTLEAIRVEITNCNTALTTITTEVADLKSKITNIETDNQKLKVAVSEIQTKLSEISTPKQTPTPAPDKIVPNKDVSVQKTLTKNGPK